MKRLFFIILCLSTTISCKNWLPVALMHGINSSAKFVQPLACYIEQTFPGVHVNCLAVQDKDKDEIQTSFINIYQQLELLNTAIKQDTHLQQPFVAIGISQGGLLLRTWLQKYCSPNRPAIHTLITLGSPHAGYCGIPGDLWQHVQDAIEHEELDLATQNYLIGLMQSAVIRSRLIAQGAVLSQLNNRKQLASQILYSAALQRSLSIANYWRNPYSEEEYRKYSTFLPYFNNEVPHPFSEHFKDNIRSLQRIVFVASKNDEVIDPISSPHWGSYQNGYTKETALQDFLNSEQYTHNLLGLRDVHAWKRLHIETVDCKHTELPLCATVFELIRKHIEAANADTN